MTEPPVAAARDAMILRSPLGEYGFAGWGGMVHRLRREGCLGRLGLRVL